MVVAAGEAPYRAKQLQDGVLRGAHSVADITTLSKDLRARLEAQVRAWVLSGAWLWWGGPICVLLATLGAGW